MVVRYKRKNRLRTLILTGNSFRHRYVATCLAEGTNLVGILCEAKRRPVSSQAAQADADRQVIDAHLNGLREQESRSFGGLDSFPATEIRQVAYKEANSPSSFDWVTRLAPEVVVLYGTSIIRPPLLTRYDGRMINLHLGLSPYYRGAGTNFWPLVNREPECVGATIHLAVRKVDAGAILAQVRPEAGSKDSAHVLGMKTIEAAGRFLPEVLRQYVAGRIQPRPQDLSKGRVFRRSDFNADAVRRMLRHFETGMMPEYLHDLQSRQAVFPIAELP